MNKKTTPKEEKAIELEKLKLLNEQKKMVDKASIFHFLFGSSLGIALGIVNYLVFQTIIPYSILFLTILGVILIPILEYSAHKLITGYSTLTTTNALVDLLFANIGMVLFLLICSFFLKSNV
ncbi:MAG TPA: hypothetical protein VGB37_10305 [Candidatus Lokiarchaeia archaeon]